MTTYIIDVRELEALSLFASTEKTRYYLNGVCFEHIKGNDSPGLIATDGHRLGALRVTKADPVGEQFILSSDDIKKIVALYKPFAKEYKTRLDYLRLRVTHDKGALKLALILTDRETDAVKELASFDSKAVDGHFPDWRRVVPDREDSDDCAICFNPAYIADFGEAGKLLTGLRSPALGLHITGKHNPMLIDIKGRDDFTGVLMPMRG